MDDSPLARPAAPVASRPPPVHNADIAAAFDEIADILDIESANPFRVRAYRNAARIVGGYGRDLAAQIAAGVALPKMPGIGHDLAGKITEIATTGTSALLQRLRREIPPSLVALLKIPGLGPKRVRFLYQDLGIRTPEQLRQAARSGQIRKLRGFGEALEEKILHGAEAEFGRAHRMLAATAGPVAERLVGALRRVPGVAQAEVAGSLRRGRETVGDLDVLAAAADSAPVMAAFVGYDEVQDVLSQGPTRATVVLRSGLQADLRVVKPEAYGAALVYFTGSKAHNIALRRRAQQQELKLSEYGLFQGRRPVAAGTEAAVYRALGLRWIPPELREDRGEIEAAAAKRLPKLIELADLKGDLHAHTRATDGRDTLEQMAQAAKDAGLEYLAITDHSRRLAMAHGLDTAELQRQIDTIDELNARLSGITLLKGIEVDILENGDLDLPERVLRRLDLVVAAVHSHLDLSRQKQTHRIQRALDHPCITILAHPTGRLLGERDPCDVDMGAIIAAARDRGCFLELNAQPQRLDLFDEHCRMAKDQGVLISVNSDAHGAGELGFLRHGITQARRGWLEAADVLNTRPLAALRPILEGCFRP